MKTFYRYHVFFCCNQRKNGETCCEDAGAAGMREYAKQRCKSLGIHAPGGIRINKAGCMGRCEQGPVVVIYPQGIWYTYVDEADIDEIIDEQLLHGRVVERLRIDR
ncbi:MAG TPA: (2Fe-2S) ferredoxin domain-containing protein [Gammaproteobacteria bacterium]|nr:(2Fe-2S) ferredoxin domain-containing protein [Gammaproteobacteria bacterium]